MDNSSESDKEYPSANVLLEMVKEEYSKERERANNLDNKASFFISLIVLVATIFVPIIPFRSLKSYYLAFSFCCFGKCMVTFTLTLNAMAFVLLGVAFSRFYKAYNLTEYCRANTDWVTFEDNQKKQIDLMNKELSDHYKEVVDYNIEKNNMKCDFISYGIRLCVIGISILVLSSIVLLIIIGE